MRILICTDNFYPGIGGTEAAVLGYAEALVRMGHEVLLACPDYGSDGENGFTTPFDDKVVAERFIEVFLGKAKYREADKCTADMVLTAWENTVYIHLPLSACLCAKKFNMLNIVKKIIFRSACHSVCYRRPAYFRKPQITFGRNGNYSIAG